MKFCNTFSIEISTALTPLEQEFRRLITQYPALHPQSVCELPEAEPLLKEAVSHVGTQDSLSRLFLDTLQEDSFFRTGYDVELYRHLRYLPAIRHSHDFLEQAFFGVLSENDILSDFFMRTLYHSKSHPFLLFRAGYDQELFNYIGFACHEFRHNRQYKNRMLVSVINAFFIILLRNHSADVILPDSKPQGGDENLIFLLKYMQEHYADITLSDLALFFHYSERQLQRIIKNSTGMSFSENIRKLKMRRALRLLEDPELSSERIAEILGYADAGNFRAVFKKYYGYTPNEYRSRL